MIGDAEGAKGHRLLSPSRARGLFCCARNRKQQPRRWPDLPERQRQLDLSHLHSIVLDRLLGLDAEKVREQTNIRYLRDAGEAVEQVRRGEADVAFLTNPVTMEQLREVAFAGAVMPQKSTDFYPKLLSGLDDLCAGVGCLLGRMRRRVASRLLTAVVVAVRIRRWRTDSVQSRLPDLWWCWMRRTVAMTAAGSLASGQMEKAFTLAFSVRLRSLLGARGITVVTTRESDVTVDAERRAEIANHAKARSLPEPACDGERRRGSPVYVVAAAGSTGPFCALEDRAGRVGDAQPGAGGSAELGAAARGFNVTLGRTALIRSRQHDLPGTGR